MYALQHITLWQNTMLLKKILDLRNPNLSGVFGQLSHKLLYNICNSKQHPITSANAITYISDLVLITL